MHREPDLAWLEAASLVRAEPRWPPHATGHPPESMNGKSVRWPGRPGDLQHHFPWIPPTMIVGVSHGVSRTVFTGASAWPTKKPAASLCYFQSLQPAKKKTVGIRSLRLVSLVVQRFSTSGIMFPCCRPRMGLHSDQRLKDGDSRGGRFFISRCITTEPRHRSLPDASRDGRSCDLRIPAQANAPAGSREPCPVRQDGTELDWVSRHRQRVAVSRISMGFPFGARGWIPPDKVKVSEALVHCQGKSADRAVLLSIKRSTPILGGSPR